MVIMDNPNALPADVNMTIDPNIEYARLVDDYLWLCVSGNTDEAEVRAMYAHKHHCQPERVFRYRGIYYAGPTGNAPKLQRFCHRDWTLTGGDTGQASVALALALACAVAVCVVLLGGAMMGGTP
jgi:hypothetical protein